MTPCSFNHKEVVFKRGGLGDCMYFLEHGSVKMECPADENRKFTFFAGSFFGVEQVVCAPPGRYYRAPLELHATTAGAVVIWMTLGD